MPSASGFRSDRILIHTTAIHTYSSTLREARLAQSLSLSTPQILIRLSPSSSHESLDVGLRQRNCAAENVLPRHGAQTLQKRGEAGQGVLVKVSPGARPRVKASQLAKYLPSSRGPSAGGEHATAGEEHASTSSLASHLP